MMNFPFYDHFAKVLEKELILSDDNPIIVKIPLKIRHILENVGRNKRCFYGKSKSRYWLWR